MKYREWTCTRASLRVKQPLKQHLISVIHSVSDGHLSCIVKGLFK